MKILITGIAGFIGSHVAEHLHNLGHEVVGIDNFSDYYPVDLKNKNAAVLKAKGIEILEADLRDIASISKLPESIEYIFHFAAQPGIAATSTFEDYLTNNVIATQNLLTYALAQTSLQLFVNIGTSSIYGLNATFPETVAPKPASHYGVTKLAAEQLVLCNSRLNKLNGCSLRLYSVYGSRERPDKLFTKLLDCGLNDKTFPLFEGSLTHLRSFTHVSDIVKGITSVIGKEDVCNGEIFNIGTEAEYTTQEGVDAVEKLLNATIKFKMLPPRSGDQQRTKANIDKARKLLNYNPTVTLEEGVAEQLEWFRNL
ncbi:NAD-dependent epimerase/dehydratase family protein [Kordia sp. YSTF-M3]|uniref:NAD-dependent epimerase/dehydratase family protein n=1 Tax=Kordia aestuariivivens TaxID=2759037 RepID=A0ABR7Q7S0_9FLAO|nr:NAD-dependent epimerase/dehydratase family protein [Kordia aestuariivivens]MBC8754614.1 NAD-dependent epimerase/dehydratase family protein [Kordia aestuariivivens]